MHTELCSGLDTINKQVLETPPWPFSAAAGRFPAESVAGVMSPVQNGPVCFCQASSAWTLGPARRVDGLFSLTPSVCTRRPVCEPVDEGWQSRFKEVSEASAEPSLKRPSSLAELWSFLCFCCCGYKKKKKTIRLRLVSTTP